MLRKSLRAVAVLFAVSSSVSQAKGVLSWQACVDEVAKNNSELQAARKTLQASEASKSAAASGFYPQITGTLSYNYGTGTTSAGATTTQTSLQSGGGSADSSYSAGLTATQNLFSGFLDRAKVEQATANVRVSATQLDTVKAKISNDLKTAFAGLLFAQRSVALQDEVIRRREENLRLVELRFQSGRENRGSVLLSKAYLAQAKYDALQARNNIRTYRAQLTRALGRDVEDEIELKDDVPLEPAIANPDFKTLAQETPEHRQAAAQTESTEAAVTIARSGFYPSINLTASTSRTGREWFPQNDRWSIGASFSLPLFTGGKDYYGTESAIATRAAAESTRANTDRQLIAKLKQAHAAYLEATEKLNVDESFREAALKRAEIARSKYNNGLMTFDDWDVIENDLIARERAVLQSQRDRTIAESAWVQVLGKGVIQ